jgi:hypothetical protein
MKKALPVLLLFIVMAAVSCVNLSEVRIKTKGHRGPPEFVINSSPSLIVISGTYAYFVAGVEVEIIFHSGHWYRPHKGRWYRGRGYNGPWVHVERDHVPGVFSNLPPGYRKIPPGHKRIPYGQLKKNWRRWEKERHWDKPKAKHKGKGPKHKGRGRY